MSHFIGGADREQAWMLPQCVEDYVALDNPVRFIDLFVEGLDAAKIQLTAQPAATGRPSYAPTDLLKLYLYGYLNRVRSSRELERLTQRNLEVMWLLKLLRPDHKTISEFRRTHRATFKQVFRQFNVMCRDLKLFGAELVAIDGSFFKAVNSKSRNFTLAKLEGLLQAVDTGIEQYLRELELNDGSGESAAALGGGKVARIKNASERMEALQSAKARYEQMLGELAASGEGQISLSDPDARLMRKSDRKDNIVGYNVQSSVDGAHHLIVELEATNQGNDGGQFNRMAQGARRELQTETLVAVADGGYYSTNDLKEAQAQGITAHVPPPRDRMDTQGLYPRTDFSYHKEHDEYQCPGGSRLKRHSDSVQHVRYQVYYNTAACARCALRAQCTTGAYRKIKHEEHPEVMEGMRQRMQAQPQVYARRKALVEHPFGTLKFWWGHGAFLTRGLEGVNAEISLSAWAYNMTRAINVLGIQPLLAWAGLSQPKAVC